MRHLIVIVLVLMGCTRSVKSISNKSAGDNGSLTNDSGPQRISTSPATSEQCKSGGTVYVIYTDTNNNFNRDAEEPIQSEQVICNGTNGFDTLFAIERVTTSFCPSTTGLQINFGLDTNRSAQLEPSEYGQPQILCDGEAGASLAFQIITAPDDACPNGGSTIFVSFDENRSGVYNPLSDHQQSTTICNGTNASVAAYTPVAPIYVCGHQGSFDEVLLRLESGQILASFSAQANGQNTRLVFLPDGDYQTTDGRNCSFSIRTSHEARSISWEGQIQASWPMK